MKARLSLILILLRCTNTKDNSGEGAGAGLSQDANDKAGEDQLNQNSDISSATEDIQVKSSLLKDYKGVKVTGPCNASFLVFFAPYLFIDVDADSSNIYLGTDLSDLEVTEQMGKGEHEKNKCEEGKTFKFVAFIEDDHLTVKWKVYDSGVQPPTPGM
ncbi:hypothetical protein AK88_03810 [Plasmodium fragile]|uniref:Uncharacterized protein n=1 Tax=Plasmodium fragile TaxID=5857 RepID=A0A0D9QHL3_PLAFR|nr:uncharacterized protein AK88_03810 [Plasmodium fragile]KJP86519.1 hypothetical protein AK88_03810 [Plasmodium fragile]